jgi:predicted TIM-barrel fold metal-dependent hydrolase
VTRIDLHAHVMPDAYRDLLAGPDGRPFPAPPARLVDLTEMMDRYEIDAAVISTGPPGAFLGDPVRAREIARTANEAIAAIVRDDPKRFAGLGLLPLPDVEAAVDELGVALDDLGLDGVMLLSNVAGQYLGDPGWEPLYEELHRRGTYAFVHPALPPHPLPLGDLHPMWLYEFPFETTRALANLIFSGTLERHPGIRLQFAHLGGTAPFLAHRLASLADREPERAEQAPAGAVQYLRRQHYDTGLTNNRPAIEATRALAPLDRIVFGTDWPYAALPPTGTDPAPDLGFLSDGERAAVDHLNAAALVPRLAGGGHGAGRAPARAGIGDLMG